MEARLVRYCCEVDFVASVVVAEAAPADPLPWLLEDLRAVRSGPVRDGLWVRVHDVPLALGARRYPVPGRLRLAVQDPDGHVHAYLLEVDEAGTGHCRAHKGEPDLTLDVQGLAGLWLGGGDTTPTVAALVSAGRAAVRDAAALARAHALFSWPVPPRVLTHF